MEARRLFLAEDCLLPGLAEGPLTRKLPLKLDASAAISDPEPTPSQVTLKVRNRYIAAIVMEMN
jgi:hypothetical protein